MDIESARKFTNERTRIEIGGTQIVDDGMFAVEQHLGVDHLQRQRQRGRQVSRLLKETASVSATATLGFLIVSCQQTQKLADGRVRKKASVSRLRLAEDCGDFQTARGTDDGTLSAAAGQRRQRIETPEVAQGAVTQQIFLVNHERDHAACGLARTLSRKRRYSNPRYSRM